MSIVFFRNPQKESRAEKRSRLLAIDEAYIPWRLALRIALFYAVVSGAWILLSDELMAHLVWDRQAVIYVSVFKGWFFVFASGVWIFTLVRGILQEVKKIEVTLKESNRELRGAQELSNSVVEQMSDAFALYEIVYNEQGEPCDFVYRKINSSFAAFAGLTKEDILGERASQLSDRIAPSRADWLQLLSAAAKNRRPQTFNSYSLPLERWYTVNIYSPQEGVLISVYHDITEMKNQQVNLLRKSQQLEETVMLLEESQEELQESNKTLRSYQEKLRQVAYYDHLTGLANRSMLYENLMESLYAKEHEKIAMLFIDADNIKLINDTLGHTYGDQLIAGVGNRLVSVVGESKYVYRLGGDEFIIWRGYSEYSEIEKMALRIIQSFKAPLPIGNTLVHTSVSVGISLYPSDGENVSDLLKCADIALYRAKASGKNCYMRYDNSMRETVNQRMDIEKYLRTALENGELEVYFQPQVHIQTGKLASFEALARWFSPRLGRVDTEQFIKVAEDTHLIMPIGNWVLSKACLFIKSLHERGYTSLTVSVNISMLQLLQEDFIHCVTTALAEADLEPQYLEIEITESILMETYEAIRQKLEWLQDRGVRIALDDFGKGYSSLTYLHQLPITTLKIDKTFTDSIGPGNEESSIMDGIVMIGRKMGMTVVAEGVETQAQLDYLRRHKCHIAQGFIFSRPLTWEDAVEYAIAQDSTLRLGLCETTAP